MIKKTIRLGGWFFYIKIFLYIFAKSAKLLSSV